MRRQEVIEELKVNHVFFRDYSVVFLLCWHVGILVLILFLLVVNVVGLLLRPELQIGILDRNKQLGNLLVLLSRIILAYDQLRKACEREEVIVHDAFVLHNSHKLLVKRMELGKHIICLLYQAGQVIWLETLSTLREADQEANECFFVFVLSPQVILEVRVDLVALMHEGQVIGEHDEVFVAYLVKSLDIPFELLFHTLSKAVSLPPHLELRLEVSKALSYQFYVQDAAHTV